MAEPFSPEQAEIANKFFDALRDATKEIDPATQEKIKAAKAAEDARKKLEEFKDALADATVNGVISYGKALTSSEQGFGKFGSTITGVTGVVGNFASTFGIAGKIVGSFIKIFGDVVTASLKQNDDLVKSYQQLSEMGSVTAGGLEGLGDQLRSVGLTVSEFSKLTDALKPVSRELVTFGGSVTGGRDKLLKVMGGLIGPGNEFERSLMRLGYTTQDIREGAAQYVAQQSLLGFAQNKSAKELSKGSSEYLVTLKKLQELTGMNADEAEKAMQAQLNDARMDQMLSEMKEGEAKNLQAYLASYEETFGKDAAGGLKELILNQGRIVGDASARAFQSTQGKAYEAAMRAAKEGPDAFRRELKNVAGGVTAQGKQFRTSLNLMGDGISDLTADNQAQLGARRLMQETDEQYAKRMRELAATSKNAGEGMENNISNEQRTRAIRLAADKMLQQVGGVTVSLFTKLNTAMFKFGKVLANMVDKFSTWLGWNNPHISDMFRDLDDNVQDLTKAQDKKANLEQQLEEAKQKLADVKDPEGAAKRSQMAIDAQTESVGKLKEALKQVPSGKDHSAERAKLQQQIDVEQKKLNSLIATKKWDEKHKISEAERQKLVLKLEKDVEEARSNYDRLAKENQSMGGTAVSTENTSDLNTYLQKTALVESDGNAKAGAGTSSAKGLFQFTEGTWAQMTKEMGKNYTKEDRLDPKKAAEVMAYFTAKNREALEKGTGKIANDADMYMAHFLGSAGAVQFLNKMKDDQNAKASTVVSKDSMAANRNIFYDRQGMERTVGQVYELMADKMTKAGARLQTGEKVSQDVKNISVNPKAQGRFGGLFEGPESGYPVTMHGRERILDPQQTEAFDNFFANTGKKLDALGQTPSMTDILSKLSGQNRPVTEMNNMFSLTKMDIDNVNTFNDTIKQVVASIIEANKRIQEDKAETTTKSTQVQQITAPETNTMDDRILSVFNTMVDKLDSLIDINAKSKNIQDDILTHHRA